MFSKTVIISKSVRKSELNTLEKFFYQCRSLTTKLVFKKHGEPADVIEKVTENTPEPSQNEVLIQLLAAPINPVDINIIQGKYPIKKSLPSVAGYEGVGKIVKTGKEVKKLKVGDHVLPLDYNLGTWSTHMIVHEDLLKQIPAELPPPEASILLTNPCTVYRMLKDFVELKQGDTLVQNAANSSCGQLALQLCKIWGVKTVNIVRNRENIEELKKELKNLGADYVLTEEEFRSTDIFKSGELKKPKLGLNCVGGKSSTEIIRKLDAEGVMVTYGGMSMEPIPVATSALIFKDIKILGFNVNFWNTKCDANERDRMLNELILMFLNKGLKIPPYVPIKLDDYKDALRGGLQSISGRKIIFEFA